MPRIYGGIEEVDLQILIRETMQDLLSQRDDVIQGISAHLDKVDERTRQGLAGLDERMEAMMRQLQLKADTTLLESHRSSMESLVQSKFDGVDYRCAAVDDRISTLTQRAATHGKEIERRVEESRETNERLDDLSNRLQHKADSAYVDVRIAELRTQVQRKAEAEDFDQSSAQLKQTVSECRKKLGEKDEQMHLMLQQLAGKAEVTAVNTVIEDIQQKSSEWNAEVTNAAKDLDRLSSQVHRVEEQMCLKSKTLGDEQMALEKRFNDIADHVISRAVSGAPDDNTPLVRSPRLLQAQALTASMLPLAASQQLDNLSPRGSLTNSSQIPVRGRISSASSYATQCVAGHPPPSPVGTHLMLQPPAGPPYGSLEMASSSRSQARAEPEGAQMLRTSQLQQPPRQEISRSSSAPGLHRLSLMGTSTGSVTSGQGICNSLGSSTTATPRMSGAANPVPLSSLLWAPQVGKQAIAEGKGLGRGLAVPHLSFNAGHR